MAKRNTVWFLSVILAFGAFCLPECVKADNGSVYNSLDAWYEPENLSTENTYNGSAEWKWERKDSGKDWFDFVKFHSDRQSFGMMPENVVGSENRVKGPAWTTDAGSWNHPAVGKGWMIPYGQSGKPDNAVSKTFTAPRSGKVSLSAYGGYIYGGSNQPGKNNNRTAFIRITKNNECIWPEEGGGVRIPEDTPSQKYEFTPVTAEISEGDVLRFEVYNGDENDSGSGKYVYWIPVVSYIYDGQITLQPASLNDVPLQQIFTMSFSESMDEITEDNISISPSDSGATVKNVSNGDDGTSVSFNFEGLKGNSRYTVSVDGIRPFNGGYDEFTYTFEFTTEEILEYPIYESDMAWPNNLTADNMTNQDEVWKWLYKNNSTKDTLNPYMPYTLTAQNQTQSYSKPPQNDDGSYDYATVLSPSSSSENITRVYCDLQDSAYARNSMGRWWMRPAVATQSEPLQSKDNEIVKAFTAPETGIVSISAKDLNGNSKIYNRKITEANVNGAVLRIIKKCPDVPDEEIWTHTFQYTTATVPQNGLAEYDFEPISADIKKGEQLWFVVSSELGGSAYSKQVFWNPVVEYTSLYPNIIDMTPENKATGVAPNFEQKISFDYPIQDVALSDIEIDGGAAVNKVGLEDGNTTLCISYSNLKPYTEYNVKLRNVKIEKALDDSCRIYEISFTTGSAVQMGEIYVFKGQLKAGANIICADVNNSTGTAAPVGAAFMVSVCKGTETDYDIISTDTLYRKDIGKNDTLSIKVDLPDVDNHFVKAVLLEDVSSARALTPIKILKK